MAPSSVGRSCPRRRSDRSVFFFQAEDGIRDYKVTGVQTCALPIFGAVVGVQPFGGHGLSGTGPKAGGPHYLTRFATEQTVTVNTAAAGGNAALMSEIGRAACRGRV